MDRSKRHASFAAQMSCLCGSVRGAVQRRRHLGRMCSLPSDIAASCVRRRAGRPGVEASEWRKTGRYVNALAVFPTQSSMVDKLVGTFEKDFTSLAHPVGQPIRKHYAHIASQAAPGASGRIRRYSTVPLDSLLIVVRRLFSECGLRPSR